jgi:putative phosphoesterase
MLGGRMRIGIVSDTHNNLRNCERIVEIFNASGVERVLHTGDITQPRTLRVLAGLRAPLWGVYGNNDLERPELEATCAALSMQFVDPPLRLEWAGRRIAVLHDPLEGSAVLLAASEVVVHGHTHRRAIERVNGALVVNPGESAGHLAGHNAVGILDLRTLGVEIERF